MIIQNPGLVDSTADMSIFSFHPVKSITTGEGGAVLTSNQKFAERLRAFRMHGITKRHPDWRYEVSVLGQNGRLTDIQSAPCFLKKLYANTFKCKMYSSLKLFSERWRNSLSLNKFRALSNINRDRSKISQNIELAACFETFPISVHPWFATYFAPEVPVIYVELALRQKLLNLKEYRAD